MRVVTASNDKTAQVWDAATGQPLTSLAHRGPVMRAVFSPDGTRVVTASNDKTARVWDAATGPVVSVAFSPDGMRVVTASNDKTARVWDVPLDMGTLDDWSRVAERGPFVLIDGVLTRRSPPRAKPTPPN